MARTTRSSSASGRSAGAARFAVAAHGNAPTLDGGTTQGVDDAIRDLVGNLDERKTFGDLDGADSARVYACLVDDGALEVGGTNLGKASRPDVEPRHVPFGSDALGPALGAA